MSLLISQSVEVILSKCGPNYYSTWPYAVKYEITTDLLQGPLFYRYYLRSELSGMVINSSYLHLNNANCQILKFYKT